MTIEQILLIGLAGLWAGTINAIVGSGTLVTFPVLIALGFSPVTATTSNAIGLISGSITAASGYRRELGNHWALVRRLAIASFLGACCGAGLLLLLPHAIFEAVVPVLIAFSVLLVVVQPVLAKRARARGEATHKTGPLLYLLIFSVGIYGGYFTAAQGIMLVGVLGLYLTLSLQTINGIKNVLAAVVNLVSGAIYAVVAPVDWRIVAIIAVSSIIGGFLGARYGRRLSPRALRGLIVVIGIAAIANMLL